MSDLLTPKEVADRLKISVGKVHDLCRQRKLSCVQVNARVRRFTEKQVEDFIQSQTVEFLNTPRGAVVRRPAGMLPFTPEKRGESSESPGADESDPKKIGKEIRSLCR
ncbi:helix-turn-helix domain-containing protein [Desulfomonile tiedjei]|uniref:Helix-turn-helix domain-containing protein n=1 Tax=Desulfomonile tiedjei (strain ATCC 49306 / DSM 6799 / DCB-1) TaxID=706587 RepID=I4C986_DESTA|nr:helix-turn-helix domain-containing protein [Desulfomonile tiedjei]AFM26127.1 hypothetical protein Desti_3476 [Desulfomonile tiedjei DSM 6799]